MNIYKNLNRNIDKDCFVQETLKEEEIQNAIDDILEKLNEEQYLTDTFFKVFQKIISSFTDEQIKTFFANQKGDMDKKVKLFKDCFEIWREEISRRLIKMAYGAVQNVGGTMQEALLVADSFLYDESYYLDSFFTSFSQFLLLFDLFEVDSDVKMSNL